MNRSNSLLLPLFQGLNIPFYFFIVVFYCLNILFDLLHERTNVFVDDGFTRSLGYIFIFRGFTYFSEMLKPDVSHIRQILL